MITIFNELGNAKLTVDDEIMEEFAVLEENIGKKKARRIYRTDKTNFRVNIEGIGFIPTVSTLLFENAHGGYLLFWAHKSIAFRTESLINKSVHLSLTKDGDIDIKIEENLKQGME